MKKGHSRGYWRRNELSNSTSSRARSRSNRGSNIGRRQCHKGRYRAENYPGPHLSHLEASRNSAQNLRTTVRIAPPEVTSVPNSCNAVQQTIALFLVFLFLS